MPKLNHEQEQAASFLHGICSVVSVPGSGKTWTMMERIVKMVRDHEIPPESILGITFTRNAAEVMRTRLTGLLGVAAERVMLSTIHAFCHYLLRTEGVLFDLLTGKDQLSFIKDILKKTRLKELAPGMVVREISLAKNNLISAAEFAALYEHDEILQKVAVVYHKYDKEKQKKMLLDFEDLLVEAVNLLKHDDDVRDKYRSTYRHILIDEFQDTNPAQMEVVKLLLGGTAHGYSFWVCADESQAIFSFAGASLNNILNFKQNFPESKEFILSINYRSTPQIIKACQNLIIHNTRRIEKDFKAVNENGEDVCILEASTEEDEAEALVREINDLVQARGYAHRDIAVLYRANFQSRVIEEVFSAEKIPYHIENGLNFYDRSEVKVMLNYLRLIAHPDTYDGNDALLSIINIPNRYIGRKFISELEEFAEEKETHLFAALKSMRITIPYVRNNVKDFLNVLKPLIKRAKKSGPCEVIQTLRDSLDYDKWVTDDDIPSPDDAKIQNLNQLQLAAAKHRDIDSFLEFTESFQGNSAHDKNGVSLMTIHKSKSMEFPAVFVIGLLDGVLPTKKGDIEEERRICFVGISRAMKLLYLSYCSSYFGQTSKKSPFIEEILGAKNNEATV